LIKTLLILIVTIISLSNFAQDSTRSHWHVLGLDLTATPSFSQDDFRKLNLIVSDEVVVDKRSVQTVAGLGYTFFKWFKNPLMPSFGFHAGVGRLLRFKEYSVSPVLHPFSLRTFSGNIFIGGVAVRASWKLKRTPIINLGKTGLSFNVHGSANLDKFFGSSSQLNQTNFVPYGQVGTSLLLMGKNKVTGDYMSHPILSFDAGLSKLSVTTFRVFTIIPITEW